jgi:hypothetical protein
MMMKRKNLNNMNHQESNCLTTNKFIMEKFSEIVLKNGVHIYSNLYKYFEFTRVFLGI